MNMMSAQELIVKANRAIASAKLLHAAGDSDGACNRAYYAMFDAAKAAPFHYASALILSIKFLHSLMPALPSSTNDTVFLR